MPEYQKENPEEIPIEDLLRELPHISDKLVMRMAFGVPREVEELLLSPAHIRDLQSETKKLAATLQSQIATYRLSRQAGSRENPVWHKRVGSLYARIHSLLVRVNVEVKNLNRLESASQHAKNRDLIQAIQRHQRTVLSEYDPTPADIALWQVLD